MATFYFYFYDPGWYVLSSIHPPRLIFSTSASNIVIKTGTLVVESVWLADGWVETIAKAVLRIQPLNKCIHTCYSLQFVIIDLRFIKNSIYATNNIIYNPSSDIQRYMVWDTPNKCTNVSVSEAWGSAHPLLTFWMIKSPTGPSFLLDVDSMLCRLDTYVLP